VVPGVLNINIPGCSDTAVLSQAIDYCTPNTPGRPYSFCVIDPPQGASVGTVNSFMNTLQTQAASTFAALYYPWINGTDASANTFQATKMLPPGGFVLGQYASVDTTRGPWYAPAGLVTAINGAAGLEQTISLQNEGALNQNNINCLRVVPNSGAVIIFGARTVETQWAVVYVPIRRSLNYIESRLSDLLQFAVFQPNNQVLWTSITAACEIFLDGLAGRNAFQGNAPSSQYYVICNSTNNTPSSISQGIVNTEVGVALNYPAEFVQLTVTQFQSTGVTTVTTGV
jgi:phage tail sheath protein FI